MKYLIWVATVVVVLGCAGCQPSDGERAMALVSDAESAVYGGDTARARALVDSVHVLFPREVAARRVADTLMWRVDYARMVSSLPAISEGLARADSVVEALSGRFRFFKDERYEDVGHFEHRLLRTEQGVARCYLKPSVDEHGVASVVSHYVGLRSEHSGFGVTVDGVTTACESVEAGSVSRFDDDGTYHEMLAADAEVAGEMMRAIASGGEERVKVTLYGDGYSYYLTRSEKTAWAECHELQRALSALYRLNDVELRTQQRIEVLKRKLNVME